MTLTIDDASWRAVGRHRFEASEELDASLVLSLDVDPGRSGQLYGIDSEAAEDLFATARESGVELAVSMRIDDREVRVDTDGVIAVRADA